MHNFKSLGTIDETTQQELWRVNISGSRVKKILDPYLRVEEWDIIKGNKEADNSWTKNPKTAKKLASGHLMESVIIENFKQTLPTLAHRIIVDKRTFTSEDYPHIHANIDAFLVSEEGYQKYQNGEITAEELIKYVEQILEVKNTESMDDSELLIAYQEQAKFYSWFFNATKAPFIIYCRGGYDFGYVEVPYDNLEYVGTTLTTILEFINSLKENVRPELPATVDSEIVDVLPFDENGNPIPFYQTMVEYNRIDKQEKELKAKLEELKAAIKTFVDDNYGHAVKFVAEDMETHDQLSLSYDVRTVGGKVNWVASLDQWRMAYLAGTELAKTDGINLKKYFDVELVAPAKTGMKESAALTLRVKGA